MELSKNEMQFDFVAGYGIKDAIFMLRCHWYIVICSQNEEFVLCICRFGENVPSSLKWLFGVGFKEFS